MRLIDADKINTDIVWMTTVNKMFKEEIDKQPTVEVIGYSCWVEDPTGEEGIYYCEKCKKDSLEKYEFCPHCGFKMGGVLND